MLRIKLVQMIFKIIVENLCSHFTLKPSPFIEVIINLFLEVHEVFILPGDLQRHQIFRNELLRLNLMEELLVSDQIPTSLFSIFHLFELDD